MAKLQYDIQLNDELELAIAAGDFGVTESTERHQQLLLLYKPGQVPAYPLDGVGVGDWYQDDAGAPALKRLIQREFTKDGMQVETLKVRVMASSVDTKLKAHYR